MDIQREQLEQLGFSLPDRVTNYDRIVSKTPEELADFLWSIGNNPATGNYYLNGKLLFSCADGNGWLDWLKQEATDGT